MTPEMSTRVRELMAAERCGFGEACRLLGRRGARRKQVFARERQQQVSALAKHRALLERMHLD